MKTLLSRIPKLSFDEIGRAVSFINRVGREEKLETRKLAPEEIQSVIRFMTAIEGQQIPRLLPQNAVTLLQLTPALLEAKSAFTVHNAVAIAGPLVKDLYDKAPESSTEKKVYHDALIQAGRTCFNPRLTATTENRRLDEFTLFKPMASEILEYAPAMEKFRVRHRVGLQYRSL